MSSRHLAVAPTVALVLPTVTLILCAGLLLQVRRWQVPGDPPAGSPCRALVTPGCVRWDAPDPRKGLLPHPDDGTRFILWHAELSTTSTSADAAGRAHGGADAVQHMRRTRRPVLATETRRLLALSAYRLVLSWSGRIRRAGAVRLLVEPAGGEGLDQAFRLRWNLSRAELAAEALPLPMVLRRFVEFVSHGHGAGGDARAGAHVSGAQPLSTPALGRSEPDDRLRSACSLSATADAPCLPMLRWGGPIDLLASHNGGRPRGSASDTARVLRHLTNCSRDVRPVIEAAPLNLSGWAEEQIHMHPDVGIPLGGRRLRRSPCEPSFLALQSLAWRSAGTRAALLAALAPPRPAQPDASLSNLLERERLIPFWARSTDMSHASAVGGASPAVQVSWPRPF